MGRDGDTYQNMLNRTQEKLRDINAGENGSAVEVNGRSEKTRSVIQDTSHSYEGADHPHEFGLTRNAGEALDYIERNSGNGIDVSDEWNVEGAVAIGEPVREASSDPLEQDGGLNKHDYELMDTERADEVFSSVAGENLKDFVERNYTESEEYEEAGLLENDGGFVFETEMGSKVREYSQIIADSMDCDNEDALLKLGEGLDAVTETQSWGNKGDYIKMLGIHVDESGVHKQRDIANKIDTSQSTVSRRRNRMLEAGMFELEGDRSPYQTTDFGRAVYFMIRDSADF